ncbi:MAG: hypothetical protein ACLFQ5_05920 [Oceanicaulis sp.]
MADAIFTRRSNAPIWFYAVALIAGLWNAMGALDYTMTKLEVEAYLASMSEAQSAYFTSFPVWYTAVWAIAVWSALAASVLLLLKQKLAAPLFLVSTAFFLISAAYLYGFTAAADMMGAGGAAFSAVIFASLVFLWWFSRFSETRSWLR